MSDEDKSIIGKLAVFFTIVNLMIVLGGSIIDPFTDKVRIEEDVKILKEEQQQIESKNSKQWNKIHDLELEVKRMDVLDEKLDNVISNQEKGNERQQQIYEILQEIRSRD